MTGPPTYEEWVAGFDEAHAGWSFGELGTAGAVERIRELAGLLSGLDGRARATAQFVLTDFAQEVGPASQRRGALAQFRLAEARQDDDRELSGRLARARRGIVAITAIAADSGGDNERHALLTLNSQLAQHCYTLSRLAGEPEPADFDGVVLGSASLDGTLRYSEEYVAAPMREAFEATGVLRSEAERVRIRNAVKTTLFESSGLMSGDDAESRVDVAIRTEQLPGTDELEFGVTEAWTYGGLVPYIEAMGLDQVVPGIADVRSRCSFGCFAPAAWQLAGAIAEVSGGLTTAEVLAELNGLNRAQQWPRVAVLMFRASGLTELVPADDHDLVRERIGKSMRVLFAGVAGLASEADEVHGNDADGSDADPEVEGRLRMASAAIGCLAYQEGQSVIDAAVERYGWRRNGH